MGNENINPFSFISYEKISDEVCWLSNEAILKFNVSLGKKNKEDGTKRFFHQEYVYPSKYLDIPNSITIKRSFDFYLTIEMTGKFKSLENNVIIKPKDMIYLQTQLNESIKWFNTIFKKTKSGNIIIKGEYSNIRIPLSYNKYIELEPTIIIYEDENKIEGIRMYINSSKIYTDITIDNYFGFIYLISKFDMYQAASTMLAYLNTPFGKYIHMYDNTTDEEYKNTEINSTSINNNKIKEIDKKQNKIGKSFFDKMSELEE